MNIKRTLVVLSAFVVFAGILLMHTTVMSNKAQPPAFEANNPPVNTNCAFCHACVPSHDTTNFILEIGADTSNMSPIVSGVTTYAAGQQYYMRVTGTQNSGDYGFELTAEDSLNKGDSVSAFAVLNAATTAYQRISGYGFVSHHNANSTNQWTFTWTAPANYAGPITFYFAGNDGNNNNDDAGDQIYLLTKKIWGQTSVGINSVNADVNSFCAFPAAFTQSINLSFNLKQTGHVRGSIINLNGQVIQQILDEDMSAGNYNRAFNLSNLASGMYLVKIETGLNSAVTKVVKL